MKRLIFFIFAFCVMASLKANGQSAEPDGSDGNHSKGNMHPANAPCNILCCDKSFPYDFCNPNGTVTTKCSTNPSGGADGVPAKSFIPSCVKIIGSMRTDGYFMPNVAPPQAPPYLGEDYFSSKYTHDFGFDSDAAKGAWWQHAGDTTKFFRIVGPPNPYYDTLLYPVTSDTDSEPACCLDQPPDCDTEGGSDPCGDWQKKMGQFYLYLGAVDQYEADLVVHGAELAAYTQIWSDAQADSDANEALQNWLNVCSPPVPPSPDSNGPCCIDVYLDTNSYDFTPSTAAAITINNLGQPGYPKCGETTCPEQTRYIRINISNSALNQNLQTAVPNVSQYTLYTVHPTGFYTDPQFNPTVYNGFSVQSFFMTVEHEMGHYFGLHHPEGDAGKGDFWLCHNCYTQNPYISITGNRNPSGYQSVMAQSNIEVNTPTFPLSDDDKCQFQKLYCNPCGSSGVIEDKSEIEPSPEIFPNPTTGACQLQYEVLDRAFVQVAIYDMLGNQMRLVSSDYEEPGTRTISLGTESLPSGHYVCRVRVGENVTYINVVIEK